MKKASNDERRAHVQVGSEVWYIDQFGRKIEPRSCRVEKVTPKTIRLSGHPWATVAARAMDNTSGHVAEVELVEGGLRFYSSRLGLLVARQEVAEKEARLAEARMLHYQWEAIDLQREIDKERVVDE